MELHFTTHVVGTKAAFRLEKHQVTQTIRSKRNSITQALLAGRLRIDDEIQVTLDGRMLGLVKITYIDVTNYVNLDDAIRGGFDTLADLEQALKRAGCRFRSLNKYNLYRFQFCWLRGISA